MYGAIVVKKELYKMLLVGGIAWCVAGLAFWLSQPNYIFIGKTIVFICLIVMVYVFIKGQAIVRAIFRDGFEKNQE